MAEQTEQLHLQKPVPAPEPSLERFGGEPAPVLFPDEFQRLQRLQIDEPVVVDSTREDVSEPQQQGRLDGAREALARLRDRGRGEIEKQKRGAEPQALKREAQPASEVITETSGWFRRADGVLALDNYGQQLTQYRLNVVSEAIFAVANLRLWNRALAVAQRLQPEKIVQAAIVRLEQLRQGQLRATRNNHLYYPVQHEQPPLSPEEIEETLDPKIQALEKKLIGMTPRDNPFRYIDRFVHREHKKGSLLVDPVTLAAAHKLIEIGNTTKDPEIVREVIARLELAAENSYLIIRLNLERSESRRDANGSLVYKRSKLSTNEQQRQYDQEKFIGHYIDPLVFKLEEMEKSRQ